MNSTEIIILAITLIIFSIISYRKKALDKQGIIAGNLMGILVFYFGDKAFGNGLIPFFIIVLFFALAEFTTRQARHARKSKHEVRSTGNILGNSGAALIALVFASPIGFFSAISCALADTASSEIGMLSKTKPRLITSFRKVNPGIDGAVSSTGNFAAIIAALIIAIIHYLLFKDLKAFAIIWGSGVLGMLIDAVLGASLQKEGILNNSTVNFIACGVTAIIAVLAYGL
jgi:uncharacterized protein (TIGR00297 family)